MLATNAAMLRVFAASGYDPLITAEGHLQHVVLRIDMRAGAATRMSRREHRAARRSLQKLLAPRAVAVIGANRRPHAIGYQILANLIRHGFPGPVYPVNPVADEIAGRPSAARVQDLPQPVDLALIAVPPAALADVIRDCAEAKVGAAAAEDRSPWETGRGVLRVHSDPLAGPVISFGLAGLFSELFSDVATGVTPLTDRDATALLASLRAYPLLTGASGGDPADLPAIEDTLLRLSALVEDWPTVAEVVIDALLIGRPGEGVTAVAPAVRIANLTYR